MANRAQSTESSALRELSAILACTPEQAAMLADAVDESFYRFICAEGTSKLSAAVHYYSVGWRKGYDPNPWFSGRDYLHQNPDVADAGVEPFTHYLVNGVHEGRHRRPSRFAGAFFERDRRLQYDSERGALSNALDEFDPDYYMWMNPDAGRDPNLLLTHYIERGRHEARAHNPASRLAQLDARLSSSPEPYANYEYVLQRLQSVGSITIIIPIYNAFDKLQRCIASVLKHTTLPASLLLIDDASENGEALQVYEGFPNVRLLRNDRNLGFSGTVNRGLRQTGDDVVLLNSDTVVGPRWLENLVFAAAQRPSIGTVTAISNSAGVFTFLQDCPALSKLGDQAAEDIARLVMQTSRFFLPNTPTGNGFCMYMRRAMIDEVGLFDSATFPQGYGEENDYCMRALKAGWEHVIDDKTLIFHAESSSFGRTRRESLTQQGVANVIRLHPDYFSHTKRFVESPRLRLSKEQFSNLDVAGVLSGSSCVRPRVLHVIHGSGPGGTMVFCSDLIRAVDDYESLILMSADNRLSLYKVEKDGLALVESLDVFDQPIVTDIRNPEYRMAAYTLLTKYRFEILHIHHLIDHSFDLLDVAAALSIPVMVTFHDYYFACPSYTLLDDENVFCDGVCTPGAGSCHHGWSWLSGGPPLKHRWVLEWRERVAKALKNVAVFTAPSEDTRKRYTRLLPWLSQREFFTIEHGIDLPRANAATRPAPGEPVRILIPGFVYEHKGAKVIEALHDMDLSQRLEFHVLGRATGRVAEFAVDHGEYIREDFVWRASAISPSFVGIFSIWAETYCFVLSEAWSAGIPVLGSQLGALGDRLNETGAGWALDLRDVRKLYETILRIADDPVEYARALEAVQRVRLRSTRDMAAEYTRHYDRIRKIGLATQALGGAR